MCMAFIGLTPKANRAIIVPNDKRSCYERDEISGTSKAGVLNPEEVREASTETALAGWDNMPAMRYEKTISAKNATALGVPKL